MEILVVEDDTRIARVVERALTDAGHRVVVAYDGVEGLTHAERGLHDLIVLDWMLPEMDGVQVARELRRLKVRTPILMLTARDAVPDRVKGLDAGVDDYLTKPFALEELLARVRALVRRGGEEKQSKLSVADLSVDEETRAVERDGRSIDLTAKEFDLLVYLLRHTGKVMPKDQILDHVWGYDSGATSNVVEIYIHYLRDKIDAGFPRPLIRTVRGVGYTLRA
jgi:DNA-binding response OmpR family regulator